MSSGPPSLETVRLVAEAPDRERHLDFAARHYADPRVARWHWPGALGGSRSRDQVEAILAAQRRQWEETGFALWWWRERAGGELIGTVGLNRAEVGGEPVVEVGWSVSRSRHGEGFAPEAATASLGLGFGRIGLRRIVAFTLHGNHASRRVAEKLGMRRLNDFERKGFPHLLFGLDACEWREKGSV